MNKEFVEGEEIEEAISVSVRIRPLNQKEKNKDCKDVWRVADGNSIYSVGPDGQAIQAQSHTFDNVFEPSTSTNQVYDRVAKSLVSSVLHGVNGTVFAYGQTASGKTFTMQGEPNSPGILQLAAEQIFQEISQARHYQFLLNVSYIEVFNEQVKDLLSDSGNNLRIREDRDKGFFVEDLEMKSIISVQELLALKEEGERRRHVGSTDMNLKSSRSHTIFTLKVEMRDTRVLNNGNDDDDDDEDDDECTFGVLVGQLNLVDLAGSENARQTGAEGGRLKEGGNINKSLLTLSRVISQLANSKGKSGFINWRDSKLTQILQPSLAGNCRTAIVCCITPASKYLEESKSTLNFASRAKQIRTRAIVNEVLDGEGEMRKLKRTIRELRSELANQQAANANAEQTRERIENLKAMLLNHRAKEETESDEGMGDDDDILGGSLEPDSASKRSRRKKKKRTRRETWAPGEFSLPKRAHKKAPKITDFGGMENNANVSNRASISSASSAFQHRKSVSTEEDLEMSSVCSKVADLDQQPLPPPPPAVNMNEEQVTILKEQNATLQAEIVNIKLRHEAQLSELRNEISSAKARQIELKQLFDGKACELAELTQEMESVKSELAGKNETLGIHDGKLAEIKKEYEAKVQALSNEFQVEKEDMDEQLRTNEAKMAELKAECATLQENKESMNKRCTQLETELAQHSYSSTDTAAMIEQWKVKLEIVTGERDELKEKMAQMEKVLVENELGSQTKQVEYEKLQAMLKSLAKELSLPEEDSSSLEASAIIEAVQKVSRSSSILNEEFENTKADLADARRALERNAATMTTMEEETEELRAQFTEREQELEKAAQATETAYQRQVADLEAQLAQMHQELDDHVQGQLQSMLEEKDATIEQLKSELEEHVEKVALLTERTAQLDQLEQDLAEQTAAVAEKSSLLTKNQEGVEALSVELAGQRAKVANLMHELDQQREDNQGLAAQLAAMTKELEFEKQTNADYAEMLKTTDQPKQEEKPSTPEPSEPFVDEVTMEALRRSEMELEERGQVIADLRSQLEQTMQQHEKERSMLMEEITSMSNEVTNLLEVQASNKADMATMKEQYNGDESMVDIFFETVSVQEQIRKVQELIADQKTQMELQFEVARCVNDLVHQIEQENHQEQEGDDNEEEIDVKAKEEQVARLEKEQLQQRELEKLDAALLEKQQQLDAVLQQLQDKETKHAEHCTKTMEQLTNLQSVIETKECELQATKDDASQQIEVLSKDLEQLRHANETLQKHTQQSSNMSLVMQGEESANEVALKKKVSQLQVRLDLAEQELEKARENLAGYQEQMKQLRDKAELDMLNAQQTVEQKHEELNQVQKERAKLAELLKEKDATIKTLEQGSEAFESKLQQERSKMEEEKQQAIEEALSSNEGSQNMSDEMVDALKTSIAALEKKVSQLKESCEEKDDVIKRSQAVTEDLQEQLRKAQDQLQVLEQAATSTPKDEALAQEIEKLQQELEQKSEELKDQVKSHEELSTRLKRQKENISLIDAERQFQHEQAEKAMQELQSFKSEMETLQADHKSLQAKCATYESQCSDLTNRVMKDKERIKKLEAVKMTKEIHQRMDKLKHENKALKIENAELKATKEELMRASTAHKKQTNDQRAIQQTVEAAARRFGILSKVSPTDFIVMLSDKLAMVQQERDSFEAELRAVENQGYEENAALRDRVQQMTQAMNSLEQQHVQLSDRYEKLKNKMVTLEQEKSRANVNQYDISREMKHLQEQNKQVQEQLEDVQAQRAELEAKLAEKVALNQKIKDNYKLEMEEKEKLMNEIKDQFDEQVRQIRFLEQENLDLMVSLRKAREQEPSSTTSSAVTAPTAIPAKKAETSNPANKQSRKQGLSQTPLGKINENVLANQSVTKKPSAKKQKTGLETKKRDADSAALDENNQECQQQ